MIGEIPFFSILLPTKNRSHLLHDAVSSVIVQSFKDFELIISDNDDDPYAVLKVIETFNDVRIVYKRTNGKLSMPDNWQNALSASRGRFVTVLQDKQIYYPDALEIAYKTLISANAEVLTWRVNATRVVENKEYVALDVGVGNSWCETPESILSDFINYGCFKVWDRLPRLINSCVSRRLINEFQHDGKRFFNDVTPDLAASFIQLALTENIYHINKALVVATSNHLSGGVAVRRRGDSGKKFLAQIEQSRTVCGHVKVKNPYLVSNLIIDDYLHVTQLIGGRLENFKLDQGKYLQFLLFDVARNILDKNYMLQDLREICGHVAKLNTLTRFKLYGYFCLSLMKLSVNRVRQTIYFLVFKSSKYKVIKSI